MNTYSRNTLISSIFAGVVLVTAVFGFSNALFNTVDDVADTTQQSSKLAVKQVTQTASAQSGSCPGYSQELDSDGDCERSGNAFITVVMGTSSSTGVDANCTVSPTSTTPGTQVEFNGSGSSASSTITAYGWDFGDGNSATTTSDTTSHDYGSTGNYTGSLTVVSEDGNSDTVQCPEVTVSSGPNDPPTASCSTFPNDPKTGEKITFQGGGSSDPDGLITNYNWTITTPSGGTIGSSGSNPNYSISSAQEGTYDAELVVTDDGTPAKTDSTTCSIPVDPQPACDPGTNDNSGDPDEPWVNVTGVSDTSPPEGSTVDVYYNGNEIEDCIENGDVGDDDQASVGVYSCEWSQATSGTPWVDRYVGGDSYQICDVRNLDPTADDDTFEMTVDSTLSRIVDADDPVDSLAYDIPTGGAPSNGTITSFSGGNFTYEPDKNYYDGANADSFTYRVRDGDGGSATGKITFDIYNNEPEAVIDGEDSLDYCQDDQTKLTYDGSDSNDEQSDNPTNDQDGDAPDLLKPRLWNWSDSENEGYATGTAPFPPEKKYALQPPIDWPNQTDITLEVTDDEGENTDFTKPVTIDTPSYEPKITAPSTSPPTKPKLYLTANSADVRSTKATTTVTNLNQNSDFDVDGPDAPYDFSDLELDFSDSSVPNANDAFTYSTSSQPGSATGTLTFWVEDTSLPQGTYDVEVEVALDHSSFPDGPDACTYDEEAVSVEALLRVRTTAEF